MSVDEETGRFAELAPNSGLVEDPPNSEREPNPGLVDGPPSSGSVERASKSGLVEGSPN